MMASHIGQILTSAFYVVFLGLYTFFGFAEMELARETYLENINSSNHWISQYIYLFISALGGIGMLFWHNYTKRQENKIKMDKHAQDMEDRDLQQKIKAEELRKLKLENDRNEDSNNNQK